MKLLVVELIEPLRVILPPPFGGQILLTERKQSDKISNNELVLGLSNFWETIRFRSEKKNNASNL